MSRTTNGSPREPARRANRRGGADEPLGTTTTIPATARVVTDHRWRGVAEETCLQ